MDPATAMLLSQAGSAIIGGIASSRDAKRQREGVRNQNAENRALARMQHQHNIELWEMQNKYNHPLQQMQRLKAAGLNPRMIYGSGAASAAGTAGDVKGYDRAEARNVEEGIKEFGNMINYRAINAQTNNVEAYTALTKQKTLVEAQKALQEALNTEIKGETKEWVIDTAFENYWKTFYEADKARSQGEILKNQSEILQATKPQQINMVEQRLQSIIKNNKGQDLLNELRELERNLNEIGVQKADNLIYRALIQSGLLDKFLNLIR